MADIIKALKDVIKQVGGKVPANHDLSDHIRAVMPFGTKTEMVEIVPEQSVTYYNPEGEDWYTNVVCERIDITEGSKYIVTINGKKRELFAQVDENTVNGSIVIFDDEIYLFNSATSDEFIIEWSADLGETITIAIYEEREVVQPIDIKYLPIEEIRTALGISVPK